MAPDCDKELGNSPSAYFCGAECQERWYRGQADVETASRPALPPRGRVEHVARDTLRLTDGGARLIRELGLDQWPV